jgi:hypothetical protein
MDDSTYLEESKITTKEDSISVKLKEIKGLIESNDKIIDKLGE